MKNGVRSGSGPVPSGEILRANTAVALVLVAVVALALVAGMAGFRAARNQSRAEKAEADARQRLWNAYLDTARATRISGEPGCREAALGIVRNAAKIEVSAELRTEAVASLALSDLVPEGGLLPAPNDLVTHSVDSALEHYAYSDTHGVVHVGDLANRRPLFDLEARELGKSMQGPVRNINFSPDGKLLSARYTGAAFAVWDLQTRKILMSADLNSTEHQLGNVTFSSDSKNVITADPEAGGQIVVYEVATGRKVSTGVQAGLNFFRLRPDGKQAAIIDDGNVTLVDYPSGANTRVLSHSAPATLLMWSPDGRQLAASGEDGDIYLWDLAAGSHRVLRGHNEHCVNMGFSRDGTEFFSSSRDGTTRLWDVAEDQTTTVAEGTAESFSPDGQRLAFWTFAGFGIWTVSRSPDYRELSCPRSEGPLITLDLSPAGRWCLATLNKGVCLWDLADNDRAYYSALPEVYCGEVSPDEQSVYIGGKTGLEIWPLTNRVNGALVLDPALARRIELPASVGARALALSLDGHSAAVELTDHRLEVLDLTGQRAPVFLKDRFRLLNLRGSGSATGAGRFVMSPDGRAVAVGYNFGVDDVPGVWDSQTGELLARLNANNSVVTFSPDGQRLALAGMAHYSVWSAGDWRLLKAFDRDELSITRAAIACGREGGLLAVTSRQKSVALLSGSAGDKLFDLISPLPESVTSVRLALDGSVLVTATASDDVQVWRLGHLRQEMAAMNLGWTPGQTTTAPAADAPPGFGTELSNTRVTLALSLAGVLLAGVFAVITLRQHRASVARFLQAEAKTAQHDRELEMAKAELAHSQKMQALGTLAAGIAHDFNNLLSVIRMSNKLIARASNTPDIQEHTADIEQAAVQGKNVIRSMLGYARNETSATGPANVNAVVESTVSLLNKEFLSNIQLVLELSPESPPVAINQGRLEQVLLNLVVNASEAMQGHGKLKIGTRPQAGSRGRFQVLTPRQASQYVELQVADSGPGISPDIVGRIFEPFFSTKLGASTPGTGLGLSLVYSIAQHDGLGLGVESAPGAGAVFRVLIPVASG